MRFPYWIAVFGASFALAQTPDFSGVWKANPDKSKGLPQGASMMVIIEQKDGRLTQTNGMTTQQRGEQRTALRWDLSGKEGRGTLGGLPLKSTAKWDGANLMVAVTQPKRTSSYKYSLSPDGNTLTIESAEGDRQTVAVLDKQPAEAGAALLAPEATAESTGRYKNLKLLGSAPASSIRDTMTSWAFALGKDCNFCHVQGNFAADDKPEKATARKMVEMATAINKNHFGDRPQVRCFTCHQGSSHPPQPQV